MSRIFLALAVLALMTVGVSPIGSETQETAAEAKLSGLQVFVDITTAQAPQKMMPMMKMEDMVESDATHHLSLNLQDEKTGEKIAGAEIAVSCLSSDGKEAYSGSMEYMPQMKHYGANIVLEEKGKYYIKIVVDLKEAKSRYSITIPFVVP